MRGGSSLCKLSVNKVYKSRQLTVGGRWAAAEIGQIAVHKAVSWLNHLVRLWQSYCLNTSTRTGCWRSNTRTTKTKTSLFLNLEFFFCLFSFFFCFFFLFLSACLVHCWLVHNHSMLIFLVFYFFFFHFFLFLLLFLSWSHYFYYCKFTNTKLHTEQGQKQHQVE
jgi:hypothetical protein